MATGKLLAAKESFACDIDGQELLVRQGELIAATHPLVKQHKAMFEEPASKPDIEHAPKRRTKSK